MNELFSQKSLFAAKFCTGTKGEISREAKSRTNKEQSGQANYFPSNPPGIEPVTLKPEEEETRRPPDVDKETIKRFYATTNSVILGLVLSLIFILLVIVCVAIGKYMNRHKGDYYTKEDEGAHDAFDADTAVLQGRTGHQVEKKKEWFI